MINNIRSSPFKDLFNPENFYISKSGGGAGNNWAKGHELGEEAKEELMELINREADGSDSLEVTSFESALPSVTDALASGIHVDAFNSRRNRFRPRLLPPRTPLRSFPEKAPAHV